MFNVGFVSLEEGYSHLGNICKAELLFFFFFFVLFIFFLTP